MDAGRQKVYVLKIFLSVFFAGVASLQMELSVLREATFIFGSTAFTNRKLLFTGLPCERINTTYTD